VAKKKTTAKKAAAKKGSITLFDWESEKSASFDDPQAVRALLLGVIARVGRGPSCDHDDDPTDLVAVEIIDKADGIIAATNLVRDAKSLAEIFAETELGTDAAASSTVGDGPAAQIPLPKGRDLTMTQEDVGSLIENLWPVFCAQICKTDGEKSQTIKASITWNPPTPNRDGFVGSSAALTVSGQQITRTGRVTKKRGGGRQFDLFAESAPE
jgi:hypothetical protein